MELELILWQSAFIIYVTLHMLAKFRRFIADWRKKLRSRIRSKRGWF